jgi:hypothetical protein
MLYYYMLEETERQQDVCYFTTGSHIGMFHSN